MCRRYPTGSEVVPLVRCRPDSLFAELPPPAVVAGRSVIVPLEHLCQGTRPMHDSAMCSPKPQWSEPNTQPVWSEEHDMARGSRCRSLCRRIAASAVVAYRHAPSTGARLVGDLWSAPVPSHLFRSKGHQSQSGHLLVAIPFSDYQCPGMWRSRVKHSRISRELLIGTGSIRSVICPDAHSPIRSTSSGEFGLREPANKFEEMTSHCS
jgi:hypothetical protein